MESLKPRSVPQAIRWRVEGFIETEIKGEDYLLEKYKEIVLNIPWISNLYKIITLWDSFDVV